MAKAPKLPRVIEVSDGCYAVSIGDEVTIRWWKKNGTWSVEIKSAQGMDLVGTRTEAAVVH